MHNLRELMSGDVAARVRGSRGNAHEHAVVGDTIKIQRHAELHVKTTRVPDRFTFRKAISIFRCGDGAKGVGIERIPCVYVQITEIGIAVRISSRPVGP